MFLLLRRKYSTNYNTIVSRGRAYLKKLTSNSILLAI